MSWSNENVLEFLELYRREPHLWDPKNPQHKNRNENNNAWLRIQSSLSVNCSIIDLKKKKESLMTTFRLHWKKKLKLSDPEEYQTSWFAFPLMESFLGRKYDCDNISQMEQEEFYTNEGSYQTSTPLPDPNLHRNISYNDKKMANKLNQANSKQKNESEFKFAKKQMNDAVSYLKTAVSGKRDMDECELYGQLLAKKLRKLDEHQRDVAMHEIDNIMFKAKMQNANYSQRSFSTSPPTNRKLKSPIFIVTQQNSQQFEDENTPY